MKLSQEIKNSYSQDLAKRITWYSSVVQTYNLVRPEYSASLIAQLINTAKFPANANILEIGAGSGKATVHFAQLGYGLTCLEPNPGFCQILAKNCQSYSQVKIINRAIEEWSVQLNYFDFVLAANAWHWLNPTIAESKIYQCLKADGKLILLWNMSPQLDYSLYRKLEPVYQIHAPQLVRYETEQTQREILAELGNIMLASGKFRELRQLIVPCSLNYSAKKYLLLLSTFSPYLNLTENVRQNLWNALNSIFTQNNINQLNLSFLSAAQIFLKS